MNQLEESEQMALFQWAEALAYKFPELRLLFHIPNGGYRSKATAGRLKAAGVKSGVPDIFLPVAKGPFFGLFIELKAGKGKTSNNQDRWIDDLRKQGYSVNVCYGWERATKEIENYLNLLGDPTCYEPEQNPLGDGE